MSFLAPIIGAVAGGLLSKKGGTQKTQSEPWKDAQPWMRGLLSQGQALQDAYMQAPISDAQRMAAGNIFGLLNAGMGASQQMMDNFGMLGRGYDRSSANRTQTGFQPAQYQMPQFGMLSMGQIPNMGAGIPPSGGQPPAPPVATPGRGVSDAEYWYYLNGGGA